MIYYTTLTENGRIGATSATHHEGEHIVQVDFPEDFDFNQQNDWLLINGMLIHDPLPIPEPEPGPLDVLGERVLEVEAEQTAQKYTLNDLVLVMADLIGGAL